MKIVYNEKVLQTDKGVFFVNALKTTIKWVAAIAIICAAAVILANINGLSVTRSIADVNGTELTEAEYKYYLEMTKEQMLSEAGASATEDFWNSEIDGKKASEVAKQRAMDEMIRTEIAVQKAKDAGVTLGEAELANINAMFSDLDAAAKEQLDALEKATGADKFQLSDIMEKIFLTNAYYQSLIEQDAEFLAVEDEKVAEKVAEEYAAVKHVLILNTPQEATEEVDTEKYAADAKKKAEEILAKAVSGENFEKLVEEFGEDPGMEGNLEGYMIDKNGATLDGTGSMVPEFTQGTFAVAPGQVNPALVESSYGWHIIKRLPLPKESQTYKSMLEAAKNELTTDAFNVYIDGFKGEMSININEKIVNKIKVK